MRLRTCLCAFVVGAVLTVQASVFGTLRVIVHDPQHRPIVGANVTVTGISSGWATSGVSDSEGIAQFLAVPIGQYSVAVNSNGFSPFTSRINVIADHLEEIHAQMVVDVATYSVNVSASATENAQSSPAPRTSITRTEIAETPGADRTNSLSFITEFVPGAYMVHDQLHVRGGHQVTWAIDGVPIPNTNIVSNVGPQFDPKDMEYVEVQRGSYLADYGDRTFGVFDVLPRSGFEGKKTGELLLGYGSFHQTDDHLSFGDHTDRFAYYVSANGNRSDYGLEQPSFENLHNQSAGGGAFTSLTYNAANGDQLRFVGSARADFYQVPNDADAQVAGVRDRQREQDALATFTYLHQLSNRVVVTLSPFFHFNRAAFEGGHADVPSATDNRASTYFGGQASVGLTNGKHNARAGLYAFGQHDNTLFGLVANDGAGDAILQRQKIGGNLEAIFLEDQYRPFRWSTLSAGVRITRFSGELSETAASPRVGGAVTVPRLGWVLRASYSRFYQAPPLSTISGPLLDAAVERGFGFLQLRGERDEQHDFGLTIPLKGWSFAADYFRTAARNFFDHDVLGNSNIFFPLTIDRVRVRGTEVTVRSPVVFGRANFHLAYSHQSVEGQGAVTGGLTDFSPPPTGFFYLDHDQRDTLSAGLRSTLPRRSWASVNLSYGSGFLNGDGPAHLPSYQTVDLAVGKSFGEAWSAKITVTNIANSRYFIDLSNTFGGSHVNEPRMISGQLRYQFHY